MEALNKAINKQRNTYKIKEGRYQKWVEDNQEEESESEEVSVFELLTSVNHITGSNLDYKTVLCGEYEAQLKLANQIIKNAEQRKVNS